MQIKKKSVGTRRLDELNAGDVFDFYTTPCMKISPTHNGNPLVVSLINGGIIELRGDREVTVINGCFMVE